MSQKLDKLKRAKQAKNDEYYTRYEDVAKEVANYTGQFKGKWIYCPCDDYRWSNFYKYFKNNFKELQLKHLTATNYNLGDGAYRADFNGYEEVVSELKGCGDFRSTECTQIKDQCDLVVTNPPFSLWRDLLYWLKGGTFNQENMKRLEDFV